LGAVRRRSDLKRQLDEDLRDLSPEVREAVRRLIEDYRGENLDEKLQRLIGLERAKRLLGRK
jgi:hypothetical protein